MPIDLFEAIYSARALRRFKPDPVPDAIITRILDAAKQSARVLTDAEIDALAREPARN